MASDQFYRESQRRRHKQLALYLSIWAWTKRVECVQVSRTSLLSYLGISRLEKTRREWMYSDMKSLFSCIRPRGVRNGQIAFMYFSRCSLNDGFFPLKSIRSDDLGVYKSGGIRYGRIIILPEESEALTLLSQLAHGITDFTTKDLI